MDELDVEFSLIKPFLKERFKIWNLLINLNKKF